MKKIICFLTALSIAAAAAAFPALADDSVRVLINGEEMIFDTEPVILNDRTMVPMRAVFERLGATVEWDETLQAVTAVKGKNIMVLMIGDTKMYKNGQVIALDTAPVMIDGVTMVPLRAVSENLGVSVEWDEQSRTVSVTEEQKEDDDTWKENTGTIDLSEKTVEGEGVSVNGNDIEITQGGDFTVTGSMTDGMIHINTKDRVKLRLSGVNITNTTGPAIFFEDSDKGYITISEGSQNSITCGAEYDVDAKAAIFSNDDLEIKGQGSLSVTSHGHHGIASDDELKIEEGVIQITSERDGIHVNDGIYITGGDIEITADEDGIQSDGVLSITGGSVNITTQGEVTADTDTFPGSMEPGQRPQRGQEQAAAPTTEPTAAPEDAQPADDVSSKGIKAGTGVYVGGGVISVSSTDHSLHSAGDILISDGALTLSSSVKKGISGHGDVTVNGGSIIIPSATEGIESKAYLTVNGGEIRITCTDDGLNAGGSETEQTAEAQLGQPSSGQGGHDLELPQGSLGDMTQPSGEEAGQQPGGAMEGMDPPQDVPEDGAQPPEGEIGRHPGGMGFGGEPGGGSMMYSADKQIIINGGYLVIDAQGDGIDSNGDLTINGGVVLVNGPTSGGDSALDTNGTIYQNGGTVIAVGSAGMMEGPGEGSEQASVTARFNQTIEAGTLLYINDSQGNTLAAFAPSKNYASVIFSSPQVEEGETYTIYQGGSASGNQTDGYYTNAVCTGGQALVSVAAAFNSGAAGMGRGGFDGGQRGQRGERPSFEGEQEQQQT